MQWLLFRDSCESSFLSGQKNHNLTSIFMTSKPNITHHSEVLVASNARPAKNSTFNKIYACKFEFQSLCVA